MRQEAVIQVPDNMVKKDLGDLERIGLFPGQLTGLDAARRRYGNVLIRSSVAFVKLAVLVVFSDLFRINLVAFLIMGKGQFDADRQVFLDLFQRYFQISQADVAVQL